MNKIVRGSRIDRAKLRGGAYFETLLEQASKRGLITERELTDIRAELLETLGEVITDFTCGDSSSVMKDTAQALAEGIVYHVGSYLKTFPTPGDALLRLKSGKISDMRLNGIRIARRRVATAMGMLMQAKKSAVSLPCGLYNDALDHEISDCLKKYDYVYRPCESGRAFDYPTAHDGELLRLRGIEFYINYLSALICENNFCREFPAEQLAFTYRNCGSVAGARRNCDMTDSSVFNIYSAILLNAVFCEYMRKEFRTLRLNAGDCEVAEELLCERGDKDIERILTDACSRLRTGDIDYNLRTFGKHMKTILNAIANRSLARLLSTEK